MSSGNGVDCVVETGAQVAHDIANQLRNGGIVEVLNKLHFVEQLIRVAWVYFNNLSVGVYFDKSLNFPFEIGEMFATPSNFALRAVEWPRHFPDCTNLKPLFEWGSEQLRRTPKERPGLSLPKVDWLPESELLARHRPKSACAEAKTDHVGPGQRPDHAEAEMCFQSAGELLLYPLVEDGCAEAPDLADL